jgi:hypothetical protein
VSAAFSRIPMMVINLVFSENFSSLSPCSKARTGRKSSRGKDLLCTGLRIRSLSHPAIALTRGGKWFRNLAVARIVAETLESLGMKFPEPTVNIKDIARKYHHAGLEEEKQIGKSKWKELITEASRVIEKRAGKSDIATQYGREAPLTKEPEDFAKS